MCLSLGAFLFVVTTRFMKKKVSYTATLFILNASNLQPSLQIQTFTPCLCIFFSQKVTNYPYLPREFVGDFSRSFVTFRSLFQGE